MTKAKKRILIVDDDEDILESLRVVLEIEGYEVQTTEKGDDIYPLVRAFQPQVILLDILLSGMDGRAICKKLKADPMTRSIPVCMLSAYPEGVKSIAEYGADAFIDKPFEVSTLLGQIRKFTQ